jgi:hypothetical protein
LSQLLRATVHDVRIEDLAVLRKSNLAKMRARDVAGFLRKILAARKRMKRYDLIYINTILVMDYIVAASLVRCPRIIHVHEIPTGGAALLFSALLLVSRAFLIFNSHATRRSFFCPVGSHGPSSGTAFQLRSSQSKPRSTAR